MKTSRGKICNNLQIYINSEYRTSTYDTNITWTYECWVYRTLEVTALMHHEVGNIDIKGSRVKAQQRSLARQMHDKLNLHPQILHPRFYIPRFYIPRFYIPRFYIPRFYIPRFYIPRFYSNNLALTHTLTNNLTHRPYPNLYP